MIKLTATDSPFSDLIISRSTPGRSAEAYPMRSILFFFAIGLVAGLPAADTAADEVRSVETQSAESKYCKSNEVPYFEAGCTGKGTVRCWPQNLRPTPMEACLCNGKQGNAPLPGGGLRWRHAGKCKN